MRNAVLCPALLKVLRQLCDRTDIEVLRADTVEMMEFFESFEWAR